MMQEETVGNRVGGAVGSQAVLWVIAVSLAVIAVNMSMGHRDPLLPPAYGQAARQAGARGVFAFTGQLTANTYGLFMVDVDAMTIWCYEYVPTKRSLRFVAARSWMYDRYLEDFNSEPPSPGDIERMVQEQRDEKLRDLTNP